MAAKKKTVTQNCVQDSFFPFGLFFTSSLLVGAPDEHRHGVLGVLCRLQLKKNLEPLLRNSDDVL